MLKDDFRLIQVMYNYEREDTDHAYLQHSVLWFAGIV